jgi:transcriptional regulator with GAF, ATPase, and Fis domain
VGDLIGNADEARRQIILRLLEKTNGKMIEAANPLGIQVAYPQRLMRNLDLRRWLIGKHRPAQE